MKDKRFIVVKNLIEGGEISSFREIFEYLPKSAIYKAMGINYGRFITLTKNPDRFTLKELISLATIIGLSNPKLIVDLAYDQHILDKSKKK